jgi:ABC-type amino acid transport substrate-binding protein
MSTLSSRLPMLCAALLAALLTACASKPAPPAWQSSAHESLQSFTSAHLSGNTRVADIEFARARSGLAATGRAGLVAQAELIRCATRVASLEFGPCSGFEAIAEDAGPAERSYAAYIAGRWQGLDPALLPVHHRALVTMTAAAGGQSRLSGIDDPLALLVAAGALLQNGLLTPADIELATETASAQGWRRPLLAWLGVQAQRAQQAGALDVYARIQRRIGLMANVPQSFPAKAKDN